MPDYFSPHPSQRKQQGTQQWDSDDLSPLATLMGEPPLVEKEQPKGKPKFNQPASTGRPMQFYLVRGLGLLGVAVLSGVLWIAFQPKQVTGTPVAVANATAKPGGGTGAGQSGGYEFVRHTEKQDTDCAGHSYTKVPKFFEATPCEQMVRRLLTTTTTDGAKVVVALAVVTMPTPEGATALKELTDEDNTGNVKDLLREGESVPDGPKKLTEAGYSSKIDGSRVLIAESDFFDDQRKDLPLLKTISTEALKLSAK